MKKLLLSALLFPAVVYSQNNWYAEGNVGISRHAIETGINPVDATMTYDKSVKPNVSVLIGKQIAYGDYSLIDVQIGLSYPHIVTGKIGAGNYYGKRHRTSLILGVRPYPLAAYAQFNVGEKNGTRFIISTEVGSAGQIFNGVTSLFNAGLRIPIK
jgi:hypothetical protein